MIYRLLPHGRTFTVEEEPTRKLVISKNLTLEQKQWLLFIFDHDESIEFKGYTESQEQAIAHAVIYDEEFA